MFIHNDHEIRLLLFMLKKFIQPLQHFSEYCQVKTKGFMIFDCCLFMKSYINDLSPTTLNFVE